VDFSILIPLCSMIMSIHCFIGIFVGPLNTNCIKYQANQKWAKLELLLSRGKSTTLCILCHEKMRRAAVHTYHSTLMCSSQDYLVKTPIVNNRGGG
jgi:cytochrome c553